MFSSLLSSLAVYSSLFAIVAPIVIVAAIGYGWGRARMPYDGDFVSHLVMLIGSPCLIISTFTHARLDTALFAHMALVAACGIAMTALVFVIVLRLTGMPLRVYLPPMLFPNCGNTGLPLSLFAFGKEGLALALVIFMVMAVVQFSLGPAIVGGGNPLKSLVRAPVVYAAIGAVVLLYTGFSLPVWAQNTVDLLGDVSIPLMLLSLGVSLAQLHVTGMRRAVLLSVLRLGVGAAAGFVVAWLFGLEGAARGVVIIQLSMPAAVFNYMLALRYGRDPNAVAGVVIVSTVLSFLLLPLLLWLVLPPGLH
jgi:predicted permease